MVYGKTENALDIVHREMLDCHFSEVCGLKGFSVLDLGGSLELRSTIVSFYIAMFWAQFCTATEFISDSYIVV